MGQVVGVVLCPLCTASPLRPVPNREVYSLCSRLRWPQPGLSGGPGVAARCPAKVDGLRHWLGPKGVPIEAETQGRGMVLGKGSAFIRGVPG